MSHRFSNKVFIVTGAAGGIGSALARQLSAEGASLVLSDLSREPLEALASELTAQNGQVEIIPSSVTEPDLGARLAERAISRFGGIDGFVPLAGIIRFTSIRKLDAGQWDQMLAINLKSVFFTVQAIGNAMMDRQKPGSIVLMSSTSARGPRPNNVDYGVSKVGIEYLMKTFALEFAPGKIRVNTVSAGVINTAMWETVDRERGAIMGLGPGELLQKMEQEIPLGRVGAPEDVVSLIAYFLSDEAGYITGQIVIIDGGYKLNHV